MDLPGTPEEGYWHDPVVVTGCGQADEIVQTEIFGPVVTVQTFSDEGDALAMANGADFGLAATVWTRDRARAMRAIRGLDTGTVWVNTHGTTVSEMPHGGVKDSGHGSDLALSGLLEYTRLKHAMTGADLTVLGRFPCWVGKDSCESFQRRVRPTSALAAKVLSMNDRTQEVAP